MDWCAHTYYQSSVLTACIWLTWSDMISLTCSTIPCAIYWIEKFTYCCTLFPWAGEDVFKAEPFTVCDRGGSSIRRDCVIQCCRRCRGQSCAHDFGEEEQVEGDYVNHVFGGEGQVEGNIWTWSCRRRASGWQDGMNRLMEELLLVLSISLFHRVLKKSKWRMARRHEQINGGVAVKYLSTS